MKKIYSSPIVKVREVKLQNILAGSGFDEANDKEGNSGSQQGGFAKSIFDYSE